MPTVSLPEFIAAARSGDRLISFPTDTVPALAARPDVAGLIYEAKQRNQKKPLILMGAKADDLWAYVQGNDAEMQSWKTIAAKYFPGALTLVLPASDRLPTAMNPTDPTTIGIRVPNCGIARYILTLTQPLATTSVNRSGEPALMNFATINEQFPQVLTLAATEWAELDRAVAPIDQNTPPTTSGIPSTVIKWTGQGWDVLRQGSVQLDQGDS
jgi:L-threonylcarbamoyladenylate synthase